MRCVVFHILKCGECGLYATYPQPDQEFQNQLYADGSYMENTMSGAYCGSEDLQASDHLRVLEELQAATQGRRVLDVGCGIGNFLEKALEMGWDAHGVEPSAFAGQKAIERFGNRVRQCMLHEAGFEPASFDAVTIWYVLEHVPNPLDVLKNVAAVLKPGGVCCIAVPNIRYLLVRRQLASLLGRKGSRRRRYTRMSTYTNTPARR